MIKIPFRFIGKDNYNRKDIIDVYSKKLKGINPPFNKSYSFLKNSADKKIFYQNIFGRETAIYEKSKPKDNQPKYDYLCICSYDGLLSVYFINTFTFEYNIYFPKSDIEEAIYYCILNKVNFNIPNLVPQRTYYTSNYYNTKTAGLFVVNLSYRKLEEGEYVYKYFFGFAVANRYGNLILKGISDKYDTGGLSGTLLNYLDYNSVVTDVNVYYAYPYCGIVYAELYKNVLRGTQCNWHMLLFNEQSEVAIDYFYPDRNFLGSVPETEELDLAQEWEGYEVAYNNPKSFFLKDELFKFNFLGRLHFPISSEYNDDYDSRYAKIDGHLESWKSIIDDIEYSESYYRHVYKFDNTNKRQMEIFNIYGQADEIDNFLDGTKGFINVGDFDTHTKMPYKKYILEEYLDDPDEFNLAFVSEQSKVFVDYFEKDGNIYFIDIKKDSSFFEDKDKLLEESDVKIRDMTKRIKSIIGNPDFFRGYRIGRRGVI
jgi:hypothetical protein